MAILVLSHEMDKNGDLREESRKRATLAAELYHEAGGLPIVTLGWDYRDDSDICISEAMAKHLIENCGVTKELLHIDRMSRDTVGDAVFSLIQFSHLFKNGRVFVVTSDYHILRTQAVFEFVYSGFAQLKFFGAKIEAPTAKIRTEQESLSAFAKTFANVEKGNIGSILETIVTSHPYYDGTIHPKLSLDGVCWPPFLTSNK